MKRVLVVSYCFPPMPEAGALRGSFLARYLPRFGWTPTVLALAYPGERRSDIDAMYVHNPLLRASRHLCAIVPERARAQAAGAPIASITSLARGVYRRLANAQFPDAAMGWIGPAYCAAAHRMSQETYDAVVSSAYPLSSHFVAYCLARRFHLPWIADYRDLWSGNPYCTDSLLRQKVTRRFEQFIVRRAGRLTTVSPSLSDGLRDVHRRDDVVCISNGSSQEDWHGIPFVAPREFNIVYAGNLYGGLRSPDTLFAAAATLRNAGDPAGLAVRFDFYTAEAGVVAESAHRHGVLDAVRMHAVIPRADVLKRQREAAVLAILMRDSTQIASEVGSKIFEYLGAGRPIIATGPPGSVLKNILENGGAGHFAHTVAGAAAALRRMHANYSAGLFDVQLKPDFRIFAASDLAERFAAELDMLTSRT